MRRGRRIGRDRIAGSVFVVGLLAPAVFHSWPHLREIVRTAESMRGLRSWNARREMLWGEYYTALLSIRKRLPETAEVAIVLASASELQAGIFANYYLYPRRSIIYWGKENYRTHTTEGAAQNRKRPEWVVWIDESRGDPLRLMSAAEMLRQ